MSNIPIVLTQEQQAQAIANHMPGGLIFAAKNIDGTVIRKILKGFAIEFLKVDSLIALLRKDTVPDTTENFISEWEDALGIPDTCFKASGTNIERRRDIVVKLASLGLQTAPDFVELAAIFGVEITAESGSLHGVHGAIPTKIYTGGDVEARNTIVIRPTEAIGESFPYEFPITFGTAELATLECLFQKLKPANVNLVFEDPI